MSAVTALAALRTEVRRRADMENTLFVTDSEVDGYIQDSNAELYDLILEAAGPEVFTSRSYPITTVSGTAVYNIERAAENDALVYKIQKVVMTYSGAVFTLRPGARPETPTEGAAGVVGMPTHYLGVGPAITTSSSEMKRRLLLDPCPDAAYSITVYYVPCPPDLSTDATHNLYPFGGWREYIVCDAAAKCLEKEESDSRHLLLRKAQAEQRIRFHAKTLMGDGGGKIRDVDDTPERYWWAQ